MRMPSPGAAILSGTHVDAAGDDAFVDDRGVNSSTQSGRSAESAHQEAEVGAEVSFSLSAVVVPRFHWAEGDDGHPPSHPAIVLKRPRAKIRWHLTREGLGFTVESYVVATSTLARGERLESRVMSKIPWRRRSCSSGFASVASAASGTTRRLIRLTDTQLTCLLRLGLQPHTEWPLLRCSTPRLQRYCRTVYRSSCIGRGAAGSDHLPLRYNPNWIDPLASQAVASVNLP